jgi:hypothetical protein
MCRIGMAVWVLLVIVLAGLGLGAALLGVQAQGAGDGLVTSDLWRKIT